MIARHTRQFIKALEDESRLAVRLAELRPDVQPLPLAFAIHGLALEANLRRELLDEDDAFKLARRALDALLQDSAKVRAKRGRR